MLRTLHSFSNVNSRCSLSRKGGKIRKRLQAKCGFALFLCPSDLHFLTLTFIPK